MAPPEHALRLLRRPCPRCGARGVLGRTL